ncbi:hypothetical protein [Photobacterium carnosum]|uniref:hypothetical protein n=1 Tax=Photobacterium carnosum TaxID=2023717 RepID=UPI00242BA96E|nr:hypothetical protein [Photobacterium carnosum]
MHEYNIRFSRAFGTYKRTTEKLADYMLDHAVYSESYIEDGETKYRRPIVIIQNEKQYQTAQTLINSWQSACTELHEAEPDRFPLNCEYFKNKPKIIDHVALGRIYINNAVSTRTYNADRFIKKLQQIQLKCSNTPEFSTIIKKIKSELVFFNEHRNDLFRIRLTGYIDVTFSYKTDEGLEDKERINSIGIFVKASDGCIPDIKTVSDSKREQRESIYNWLTPIDSLAAFKGELYLENDVINARNGDKKLRLNVK